MKMLSVKKTIELMLFCLACMVQCDIIFNDFNTDIDQCKDVCADSFFLLPKIKDAQDICQRGCRFFNIIYLKDDHDLNVTKEECYLSCDEAYKAELKAVCDTGCNAMSKKKESELSSILVFIEQDNPKNIMLVEPELEIMETELISDPLIQSQIEIGINIEYKIPETKIRTMPIAEIVGMAENKPTGDWLDCAARNSGLPKLILLGVIVSGIFVAMVLTVSSGKKENELVELLKSVESDTEEEEFDEDDDDEDDLPPKYTEFYVNDKEIAFSNPPKYTIETEKV